MENERMEHALQIHTESTQKPLGWRLSEWCERVGICTATYYNLPADLRPPSAKLPGLRLIIEPPEAYLQRICAMQDRHENRT